MKPVMYIFANEGAGMSAPKLAAQVAHAAVEAYRNQYEESLVDIHEAQLLKAWFLGGHYTKIILAARDEDHLCTIERYITDRGFKTELIIDEGRTEIAPHTVTALGCWVVDKDDPHTAATFGDFKLLKEKSPLIDNPAFEVVPPVDPEPLDLDNLPNSTRIWKTLPGDSPAPVPQWGWGDFSSSGKVDFTKFKNVVVEEDLLKEAIEILTVSNPYSDNIKNVVDRLLDVVYPEDEETFTVDQEVFRSKDLSNFFTFLGSGVAGEDGDMYCIVCDDLPPWCESCIPRRKKDGRVNDDGSLW